MNKNLSVNSKRELLKLLDLEHLNNEEFQLLNNRKLDKNDMAWAVQHLSECRKCCLLASELTAQEIKDALTDTDYEKLTQQTIDYYFQILKEESKT